MHSRAAQQAVGPGRGLHAPVLELLAQRIAAGRADTSAQRDPDFIRLGVRGSGMTGPGLGNHWCRLPGPVR